MGLVLIPSLDLSFREREMFRNRAVALFLKGNHKALCSLRGTTPSRVLKEEHYRLFSTGITRNCLEKFRSLPKVPFSLLLYALHLFHTL